LIKLILKADYCISLSVCAMDNETSIYQSSLSKEKE